jgi:hypothetical protein
MGDTTGRAWSFMAGSLRVLKQTPRLALLPLLSVISVLATLGVFVGLALAAGSGSHFLDFLRYRSFTSVTYLRPVDVALLVGAIVSTQVVGVFFNATLVAAVMQREDGQPANIREAMRFILRRSDRIFAWACFSSSVLLVTTLIRHKGGIVGAIVAWITDLAWSLASFFVIPFLVAQDIGPWEALRRSTVLFKRTWGERMVAGFSYFFILAPVLIGIGLLSLAVGAAGGVAAGVVTAVGLIGVLSVVMGTIGTIFNVALFRWANDGVLLPGFDGAPFDEAYRPKKARKGQDAD